MELCSVMNNTISTELQRERKVWLVLNPGIVGRLSAMTGVTPAMVYMVLKGRRRSPRVEAALAAAGAPGFSKESSRVNTASKPNPKKTARSATR